MSNTAYMSGVNVNQMVICISLARPRTAQLHCQAPSDWAAETDSLSSLHQRIAIAMAAQHNFQNPHLNVWMEVCFDLDNNSQLKLTAIYYLELFKILIFLFFVSNVVDDGFTVDIYYLLLHLNKRVDSLLILCRFIPVLVFII